MVREGEPQPTVENTLGALQDHYRAGEKWEYLKRLLIWHIMSDRK